ncbi:MAG: alpha-L-rhamnosidase C-terminal domain-containing protein, partial [Bacteroidota bacterium]|nr:alpha-L-rhamnosidase C-terminal domain-containing protein [Bacteroidota bacterium]
TLLGKKVDAAYFSALYTARKKFFNKTYVNPESGETTFRGKVNDTQTSYALPLAFGIIQLENVQKAADNLVATVSRENKADDETVCPPYSLMTGFIGTAWISKALSSTGHSDVAYRLLQQTSYPSWLYPVEQGATTIWERLNSYTPVNGFGGNNSMNSFNHYSFGAVGAWMYNYSLGIERDEQSPGFNHFILQPEPDPTGQMTFAKGYYDSMYGRIESSWEQNSDGCHYRFVVPANSSATLKLKALSLSDITADGKQLKSVVGGKYSGVKHGKYTFELQSGMYEIQVKKGTN